MASEKPTTSSEDKLPNYTTLVPSTEEEQTFDSALTATCHCGRVSLELPHKPEFINECLCSVCYKYGALWAYYKRGDVMVTVSATDKDAKLMEYVREDEGADGDIAFCRCGQCGCMMLWWGVGEHAGPQHKMGVNTRMLPRKDIEGVKRETSLGPE